MARILVIDDEDALRQLLVQTLEREGYEVDEAPSGEEGVRRYLAAPAEVVIADILMPDGEGLETIQTLKQANPAVKIIAISGGGAMGRMDYLDVAERLGADCSLQKPFRLRDLIALVQGLLEPPSPSH